MEITLVPAAAAVVDIPSRRFSLISVATLRVPRISTSFSNHVGIDCVPFSKLCPFVPIWIVKFHFSSLFVFFDSNDFIAICETLKIYSILFYSILKSIWVTLLSSHTSSP